MLKLNALINNFTKEEYAQGEAKRIHPNFHPTGQLSEGLAPVIPISKTSQKMRDTFTSPPIQVGVSGTRTGLALKIDLQHILRMMSTASLVSLSLDTMNTNTQLVYSLEFRWKRLKRTTIKTRLMGKQSG